MEDTQMESEGSSESSELSFLQTRELASLARLELSDEEVRLYTTQLRQILDYVEDLKNLSIPQGIEGVKGGGLPLRQDEVRDFQRDSDGRSMIVHCAPVLSQDGLSVPLVMKGDGVEE